MPYIESVPGGYRVRHRIGGRGTPWAPAKTYATKPEAIEALERVTAQREAAEPVVAGDLIPLLTLIERWRQDRIANHRDATHIPKAGMRMATAIKEAGWSTAADVTPASVAAWKAGGGSERTGAMIRALLTWGHNYANQPVDPRALVALRPETNFAEEMGEYRTAKEIAAWMAKARMHGPAAEAMLHCLSIYGWRPITAGRLTVGDVETRHSPWLIRTTVKGRKIVRHPVLPATHALLAKIIKGRKPTDPLFPDPRTGKAFTDGGTYSVYQWFRDHIGGGVYDLKYYAINTALEHMSPAEVVQFTGQSINVVARYLRKNRKAQGRALTKLAKAHGLEHLGARTKSRANSRSGKPSKSPVKPR